MCNQMTPRMLLLTSPQTLTSHFTAGGFNYSTVMRYDYVGISVSYTELFTVTWNTFDHVDISESYPRQFTVA